jgi:hypothetical protein
MSGSVIMHIEENVGWHIRRISELTFRIVATRKFPLLNMGEQLPTRGG